MTDSIPDELRTEAHDWFGLDFDVIDYEVRIGEFLGASGESEPLVIEGSGPLEDRYPRLTE
ncbi:hypothetical protein BRC65_01425 [Halobacteriales archaeon QH_2_65_14]|nr:MAG: hypothetical protein BRC65_01425 [Halobacteriales archaeon QH_2_65_14]